MEQKPSLKAGVRFWRSRLTGELRIGTARRNLAFPTSFRGIDSEAVFKILDGYRSFKSIVLATGIPEEELRIFLATLTRERLLDWEHPEPERVESANSTNHRGAIGEAIDSIALRNRALTIERESITFREGVMDGGISAVERRSGFQILIFNVNRLAIAIAGALTAAGFDTLHLIERSPKSHRSRYVQGEDLQGGYFRRSEILHLKGPLIEELISIRNSKERLKITKPDLIISAGAPPFDAEQRWISEGTPHLVVEYENSAEVRIGPLVIPGESACLGCIELSEVESGNTLPTRESLKNYELATGLALYASGLVTQIVNEYADTGKSSLRSRTLDASTHNFLKTQLREWPRHPKCGCST